MEDGSAVAFLQQNGQSLSTILDKTSGQRREEMETLIVAAFLQLKFLDLTGVDLSVMMEYAGILGDMQNIFLSNINTASTFDIARVCCRSLKLSKETNDYSCFCKKHLCFVCLLVFKKMLVSVRLLCDFAGASPLLRAEVYRLIYSGLFDSSRSKSLTKLCRCQHCLKSNPAFTSPLIKN